VVACVPVPPYVSIIKRSPLSSEAQTSSCVLFRRREHGSSRSGTRSRFLLVMVRTAT
jgi:hypothetical protein